MVKQLLNAIYIIPMGDTWVRAPEASVPSIYVGDWPYADDGNRGLPDWFFTPPDDYHFYNLEIYDDGSAEWTGGMGVVWKRPDGANISRVELGIECDAWVKENL